MQLDFPSAFQNQRYNYSILNQSLIQYMNNMSIDLVPTGIFLSFKQTDVRSIVTCLLSDVTLAINYREITLISVSVNFGAIRIIVWNTEKFGNDNIMRIFLECVGLGIDVLYLCSILIILLML